MASAEPKGRRKAKRPVVSLADRTAHITTCWISYGFSIPALSWGPKEPTRDRVVQAYRDRGLTVSDPEDIEIKEAEVVR